MEFIEGYFNITYVAIGSVSYAHLNKSTLPIFFKVAVKLQYLITLFTFVSQRVILLNSIRNHFNNTIHKILMKLKFMIYDWLVEKRDSGTATASAAVPALDADPDHIILFLRNILTVSGN